MAWEVGELAGDEALPVLEEDRRWAAYAICDLDPPFRAHARFAGARTDGRLRAAVLVYETPGFSTIVPCGDVEGVRRVLATYGPLPQRILLSLRQEDVAALEQRYRIEERWTMLRMAVQASDLRSVPSGELELRVLGEEDAPTMQGLYADYPHAVFSAEILREGVYVGGFRDGQMIGVAGTHVVSVRRGMAAVGGVYTLPAYRGQGVATQATGSVCEVLVRKGIRDLVLNVREDNVPAISAYRRLGFAAHRQFLEGSAILLDDGR